jgi:hypothetical protein
MKKRTATEYFYDRVINIFTKYHEEDVPTIDFGKLITEAFERAKAMEKEQIVYAYDNGCAEWTSIEYSDGQHYYNSTYKL